jgi:hypothetical protein
MQRKITYIIALVLVLALGIAWIVLPEPSIRADLPLEAPEEEVREFDEKAIDADSAVAHSTSSLPVQDGESRAFVDNKNEKMAPVSVTLSVANEFYSANVFENSNVIDAMEQIALEGNLKFETRNFLGLGEFIESINGIRNGNGKYWFLYVNGESASVGASQYILSPGDAIEWRFKEQN